MRYNPRVLDAPCYVLADTHIGYAPPSVDRALLGFLDALRDEARGGRPGSLIIDGDLLEFWFEWRTVIPRPAFRVLSALAALRDAGTDVLWIAGNHDCWGGDMLRTDVGVTYQVGPWTGSVAGWRTRIEHGDGLRAREDRRYRALRSVLRNPIAIRAFRWLPPDLASRLATGSSQASRTNMRARDGGAGLRQIALNYLGSPDGPDLVIFGHSHVMTLERAAGGGVYANPGTWLDTPTYLRITSERVELRRWDGSAEGVRLDALDRRAEESPRRS
jgi:UDP-2,3-diacylglucosamine hydrolase